MIFLNKKNETNDDLIKYALYFLLFLLISLSTGPLLPEIGVIFIFFIFLKIKKQIKFDDNLKKIIFFFFNILYNN